MTDDTRLPTLLRAAMPPVHGDGPSRDLWPVVAGRKPELPKWSWLDLSIAACSAAALVVRPDWLLFLAYHF